MTGAANDRPQAAGPGSPRVGVPFRAANEEAAGRRPERYLKMVEAAGGEPVLVSLNHSREELAHVARTLDAIVLPGSAADVDPAWYHTARRVETAEADALREQADFTLLDVAFADGKPVLAICYGIQSLNVYLGGTLVQDIASETSSTLQHDWEGRAAGQPEPSHLVRIEPGTRLAALAGAAEAEVNSSHHQAVARPGRRLRPVAHAPDGIIEAVELVEAGAAPDEMTAQTSAHWVTGVQWHPERMESDPLARALFRELVAAARKQPVAGG